MSISPSMNRPNPFLLIIGIPVSLYGLLMFVLALGYLNPLYGAVVLIAIMVVLSGSLYLLIRIKKRSKNLYPLIPSLLTICIWIAFGVGVIVRLYDRSYIIDAYLLLVGGLMAIMGLMFIKLYFRALRHTFKIDPPNLGQNLVKTEQYIVSSGLILSILGLLILGYILIGDRVEPAAILSTYLVIIGGMAFILEGFFTLFRVWWLKSHSVK